MTRYWMLLLTLLMSLAPPLSAQRATYPKECTLTYIAKATTPDSTKARCIADRARVDLYNATVTYNKADSIEKAALVKLTSAKLADSLAKIQYAAVMEKYKPKPPGTPVAATVAIHSNGEGVKVGASLQLYAEVKDSAGTVIPRPVQWSGSSLAVADVSGIGLLTGKSAGTVVVSAKSDAIIAQRTYTVTAAIPPPDTTTPPDTAKPPPVDTTTPPPKPPVIFSHPYQAPSNGAQLAELPRDTVGLSVPAPARRITVNSLQAALDTARDNDLLTIPANHTTSCLSVNPTARQTWVTVQGTDSTSVITCGLGGAVSSISIASRAHHVRFLGPLSIRTATDATNAIVRSYNGERTVADVAHHIILDGVTVDSRDFQVRRCVWPDGAYMAVVRSRLLGCANKGGDAQAIIVLNGPGPYRFEGNYLEGGHQCFMSGGGDPAIPGSIPSDIVFRNNVCFKPLYWHYTTPGQYNGRERQVKTILETKNIRRALFEYNVFRNVWADAQAGFGGLLKSTNQDGTAAWSQTVDVTLRYNRFVNVANGINLAAHPQGGVAMTRVSIYDNLIDSMSTSGGEGNAFQILDDVVDNVLLHNTVTRTGNAAIMFDGAPGVRTVFNANIVPNGAYGVKGSGTGAGNATIAKWMPGGLFQNNIVPGASCSSMPATTLCTMPSPIPNAPDGKPIGADQSKIPK